MVRILSLVIVLFLFSHLSAQTNSPDPCSGAQAYHIVVLGSSTAAGSGASPSDSAWVNRYRNYLQSINSGNQVTNLAQGGYNTYRLMPTGYVPPSGRPSPDTNKNITAGIALSPDAIIVNLPSNDVASGYSVAEQLTNFDTMWTRAQNAGIPIWICTTQPRNFNATYVSRQLEVRDSIFARYGAFALDFWNGFASASGTLGTTYDSGDGVHMNNTGHRGLFGRVRDANLPLALYTPPTTPDGGMIYLRPGMDFPCGDSLYPIDLALANYGAVFPGSQTLNLQLENLNTSQVSSQTTSVPALGSCTADTQQVFVNTYSAGTYRLAAWLSVPGDVDTQNDTLWLTIESSGHPSLIPVNATGCSQTSLMLAVQSAASDSVYWFDQASGGAQVGSGPFFQTPVLNASATYWAQAARGPMFFLNSLDASQGSNINWNGTMFDLVADSALVLDSITLRVEDAGNQAVEVYTKAGSHIGFTQNATPWTQLGTYTVAVPSGGGMVTIPAGPVSLNPGDTLGIYLQLQNSGARLSYQSQGAPVSRSNAELTILTGSGVGHNFSATYFPRDWRGTVHYHFGSKPLGDCNTDRIPVEAVISIPQLSLGPDTIIDLNASLSLSAGTNFASYQWSTGGTGSTETLTGQGLGAGIHFVSVMATDSAGCMVNDTIVVGVAMLVADAEDALRLKTYPNPAATHWSVEIAAIAHLSLTDLRGKNVLGAELLPGKNDIQVNHLPAGIYLWEISSADQQSFGKMLRRD